ncbi:MAG: type II toxin-antitoxin system VapC family toxin [Methylacidiphilales bacterium]|nr:type II toxin-antitoxin system VapC family toxin [Candidatus Methylacidiphilales bacterium]
MIAYPDTSFLCAFYRLQTHSDLAAAYFKKMSEPLHVGSLLLYEFRQSLRWQEFLYSKDRSKGFDQATGMTALATIQSDLASGAVVIVPVDWSDVHNIAERLSAQYTPREGHRSFDVLHVATALHLGTKEFLTFDGNQKKLAKAEGLKVPL